MKLTVKPSEQMKLLVCEVCFSRMLFSDISETVAEHRSNVNIRKACGKKRSL